MPPSPPLRTCLPLGCRVALAGTARVGTVVGYARVGDRVWVQLDGRSAKSTSSYPVQGLRRLPADLLDDDIWYAPHTNPYRA